MNTFNSLEIPLDGAHLIEASAGTGKTYSIGILVLRLIAEKGVPIEKILVVTFTESAANELKDRIRRFIQEAISKYNKPEPDTQDKIWKVVNSGNAAERESRLRKALLDLDRAQISTIHSFCNSVLNRFAFETGQTYGKRLMTDISDILEFFVQKYKREYIANMPVSEVQSLSKILKNMTTLISNHINGKVYFNQQKLRTNDEWIQMLNEALSTVPKKEIPDSEKRINAWKQDSIITHFLKTASEQIRDWLKQQNLFTYQDLIDNLHTASNNEHLQSIISDQYSALFVDEFQDTDRKQYEIFKNLFQNSSDKTVFYIGDPKQIIFAWRSADLNTWLKAKSSVGSSVYSMTTSYRSSIHYLDALNDFYSKLKDFDGSNGPFAHKDIQYIKIEAGGTNADKKGLTRNGVTIRPLSFYPVENPADNPAEFLKVGVLKLLNGGFQLNGEPVKPSDIGILTRTNREARKLKKLLEESRVPAIVTDDTHIFETVEAGDLQKMLLAILEPSQSSIFQMLLTHTVGKKETELAYVDFDRIVLKLSELKQSWENDGLQVMLQEYFTWLGIPTEVLERREAGQRTLSNHRQMAELIQDKAIRDDLSPTAQLQYLKGKIKTGEEQNTDDYIQRIESDESAVRIATIHKSKGLEYSIVLAYGLELMNNIDARGNKITFTYSLDDGIQYFGTILNANNAYVEYRNKIIVAQNQLLQENTRLIYVALTRARFATLVWYKGTGLINMYLEHTKTQKDTQNLDDDSNLDTIGVDTSLVETNSLPFPDPKALGRRKFQRVSYSMLARDRAHQPRKQTGIHDDDSYDAFVFGQLRRGTRTGDLLHSIFEYADFQKPDDWDARIQASVLRHDPAKRNDTTYHDNLKKLVSNTLNVSIPLKGKSLQLSKLDRSTRVQELEFDFPIPNELDAATLEKIFDAGDDRQIYTRSGRYTGMMTGVIDMFFEWDGRYYILDWKSNFLGEQLEDYTQERLNEAMNESNYHLQYIIYAAALDRHLRLRLGEDYQYGQHFGGVIYLFLRGLRSDSDTGIYLAEVPEKALEWGRR